MACSTLVTRLAVFKIFLTSKLKTAKRVTSVEQANQIRKILNKYWRIRLLAYSARDTLTTLEQDTVDIEELVDKAGNILARARNVVGADDMLHHFGRGSNTKSVLDKIINGKLPELIPTGFKIYDEKCGGFRRSSVVILSANTGGLKSTVAKTLSVNIYRSAYNVAVASFEMDELEYTVRFLSELTDIDQYKFTANCLSLKEKRLVKEKWDAFQAWGKKKKKRYTILSATSADLDIEQTLAALEPFGYDVIFIDYIGLLADSDSDQQWKALAAVARKSKMFAKRTGCCVVLLAQLAEDDSLRQSKSIADHADVWWRWRITDDERETGVFEIGQVKARHGPVFKWEQGVKFETNAILNLSDIAFGKKNKFEVAGDKTEAGVNRGKTKTKKGVTEIGTEVHDLFEGELEDY